MNVEQATAERCAAVRTGSLAAWSVVVRPKTLFVAISPVLMGGTLGFERTGLPRATANGWLSTPFGELTVFVFFGLVAVNATDWVLAGSVTALASVAIGAIAPAALPFGLLPAMAWLAESATLLLPALLLPAAWQLYGRFVHGPRGVAFNEVLFRTFRLELWFAALLSAGALLGRMVG